MHACVRVHACAWMCVHDRGCVGSSNSLFLTAVLYTHLSVHCRAYCIHKQIPPSFRLRLAVTGDAGYEMPAAIAHRQISDDAQAASEEINYTLINTGTRPSRWHPPWTSAGTYAAHEQPYQLSGHDSKPANSVHLPSWWSVSPRSPYFSLTTFSSLSNGCCVRGSPFKSILCLSSPPCPSVVHTVRVPKLILLCSTAVCFHVSQNV